MEGDRYGRGAKPVDMGCEGATMTIGGLTLE
jgi:hypothetical protein